MGKGDYDVKVVWEGDGGWFKARVEEDWCGGSWPYLVFYVDEVGERRIMHKQIILNGDAIEGVEGVFEELRGMNGKEPVGEIYKVLMKLVKPEIAVLMNK